MSRAYSDPMHVTTSHLTLLEDAAHAVVEGHRIFTAQYQAAPENRSMVQIARALRATHLALEKLLKHALAKVEPHLVLEKPDGAVVRAIAKDLKDLGAPSFFATRVPIRTLHLEGAWDVVLDVLAPPISEIGGGQFAATLKDLSRKRNQAQHGELFGDPADYLVTLEQVFSQLRPLLEVLIPEALSRLSELSDTIIASLRGIEERVDAGWILLQDSVRVSGTLPIAFKIYVTLPGADKNLEVAFVEDRADSPGSLSLLTLASVAESSGLFLRLLAPDQERSRREAQTADLPLDEIPETSAPSKPQPLFGILSIPEKPEVLALRIALEKNRERQRLAIEEFGLSPLEPGQVLLPATPAWIAWSRPDAPGKKATATVVLRDCRITFEADKRKGHCRASVAPNPHYPGSADAAPMHLAADVWLTAEYLVSESHATDRLPAGAVFRLIRAAGTISSQPSVPVGDGVHPESA